MLEYHYNGINSFSFGLLRFIEVPEELQEKVELAVETCPYEALSLT